MHSLNHKCIYIYYFPIFLFLNQVHLHLSIYNRKAYLFHLLWVTYTVNDVAIPSGSLTLLTELSYTSATCTFSAISISDSVAESAIQEFKQNGSIYTIIQKLGYPSPATLYRWLEHKKAGITNCHDFAGLHKHCSGQTHSCNMPRHPHHPSAGIKPDALRRCFELGEDAEYVSKEIEYSVPAYISRDGHTWKKEGQVLCQPGRRYKENHWFPGR